MTGARILVVDDEPTAVRLIEAILRREGCEVTSAPDGAAGLWRFQEYAPDLVLLDAVLPKLSGFEVCARLRESSAVPIIMLSALPNEQDRARCLSLGANDYLGKPFDIDELAARVRAALPPEFS